MRISLLILDKVKIAKNASALVAAQVVARALGIIYVAALARYVGARGIGAISTATALNGLLVLLAAPGFTTLLVRDVAAEPGKAASYIANMLFTRGLLGIPFALSVVAAAHFAGYASETVAIIYVYLVVYLLDSLSGILAAAFQAFERMEFDAASQIVQTVVNVSLSLLAIYLRWSLFVIVFMSLIAQLCRLLCLALLLRGRMRSGFAINLNASKQLFIASFPFGALLVLFAMKAQLGIFVLSLRQSESAVGIYSAANAIIGVVLLVPSALSSAAFPAFSRFAAHSRPDLQNFYQLCFKYLLLLGFPLGLGLILVADKVILLVYGDKFEHSVAILRILSVFLFTMVGYSNGPTLKAIGRQRFLLWTEGLAVFANGALCLWLAPIWGPIGAAVAFVIAGIGTFVVHSFACHTFLGLSFPLLTTSKILLATLFMGLVVAASRQLGAPWLVTTFILAPLAYGLALWLLGIVKRSELLILAGAPISRLTANAGNTSVTTAERETVA